MAYRWPTDPPHKAPSHSRPYAGGQGVGAKPAVPRATQQAIRRDLRRTPATIGGKPVSYGQWASGGFLKALQGGGAKPAPAPAAPAAGAPAGAGAAPNPMLLPPDPLFDAQLAGLAQSKDVTVAGLGSQRTQGLANYGYTESPTGALAYDPRNPFAQAAQLKRNYDTSRRASGQTMASRGGLYSGAYQNQQDAVNRGQLQAQDTLQKSLGAFLAQNTAETANTRAKYQTDVGLASGERITRIPDNPLYMPVAPAAAPKAAKPVKAAAKTFHWPGEKRSRTHSIPFSQHRKNRKR